MVQTLLIVFVLILIYILFWTPYPFVWFLRSKKEAIVDKGPENIEQIKQKVEIYTNLSYPSSYPQATYDLYVPKKQEIRALIVWAHGRSFISGTSIGMRNFGPMLAEKGYMVCAMNYAYAPRYHFPVQICQIDEVLCHMHSELLKHGIDLDQVVLGGDSAGANLTACYASFYHNESLCQKAKIQLKNKMSLKGLLLFCGPYDLCEDFQREELKKFSFFFKYIGWSYLGHKNWQKREEKKWASPIWNIHDNFPAAYICDGKRYSFMWQGKRFSEALQKHGIEVKTRFYEHMSHEFQFEYKKYKSEAMQVYQDSLEFLDSILKKEEKKC